MPAARTAGPTPSTWQIDRVAMRTSKRPPPAEAYSASDAWLWRIRARVATANLKLLMIAVLAEPLT